MEDNHTSSPRNLQSRLSKDTTPPTQLQTIFHYLQEHIATNSMISAATGIPKRNICKYKRNMEQAGKLWEVEKKTCEETGNKAWYLTTDPAKAPGNSNSLNQFYHGNESKN
jgi:hypothetical protein